MAWLAKILLGLLVIQLAGASYVDYTYTQYLQDYQFKTYEIKNLTVPVSAFFYQHKYDFPAACSLSQKLNKQDLDFQPQNQNPSTQEFDELKQKVTDLLRLSEQIKASRSNLKELVVLDTQASKKFDDTSLRRLKEQEIALIDIKDQIESKTRTLKELLKQQRKGSQSENFIRASLNYEKSELNNKLIYLQQIQFEGAGTNEEKEVNELFDSISQRFTSEKTFMDSLIEAISKANYDSNLKGQIKALEAKIESQKLIVADKGECEKDKKKIMEKQRHNEEEFPQLMRRLKELKMKEGSQASDYCEGVSRKLEVKIKNLLNLYSYSFSCAEDYSRLSKELAQLIKELEIKKMQIVKDPQFLIKSARSEFQKNRKFLADKISEVKKIIPKEYRHTPENVEQLIHKVKSRLLQIERQLANIIVPPQVEPFDYNKIKTLVEEIKRLTGSYCQKNEKYEEATRQSWLEYRKFEQSMESKLVNRERYLEEVKHLRDLESSFLQLRGKVLSRL